MKIGTAQIDITPEPGIELCGFAKREQPSDRVLDKLYAKVLVIDSGQSFFVFINLDLIGVTTGFTVSLRGGISKLYGLPGDHIHIFATHTHSGPGTIHLNYCGEFDSQYIKDLESKLINGVSQAISGMQECRYGYTEKKFSLGVNRRHGVQTLLPLKVITFQNTEGSHKAILVNYPMHPVCQNNRGISADYPGIISKILREKLEGKPIVLFALGAAGDVDTPIVGTEYGTMAKWGGAIASAVYSMLNEKLKVNLQDDFNISIKQKSVKVRLYSKRADEIDSYADKYLVDDKWETEFGKNYRPAVEKWKRDMTQLAGKGIGGEKRLEISVMEIGVLKLIMINAELFSEFERILNEKLGIPFMVISCANGMEGYFPDIKEYDRGGYEIETSIFFYNSFLPLKGSLEEIAEEVDKMVRSVD